MEPNLQDGSDSTKCGNKSDHIHAEKCVIEIENDENEIVSPGKTEYLKRHSFVRKRSVMCRLCLRISKSDYILCIQYTVYS